MRIGSKPEHNRGIALMLATLGCAVAIAACGSSGKSSNGSGSGGQSSGVAFAQCMRAHGLSGFPDPIAGEGLPFTVNSDGSLTAEGRTFAGPALQSAEHACKAYLPPSGPPPQPSAEQVRRAVAFARCMRAHGVPNFPDPTFSGAAGSVPLLGNQQSPAFQAAFRACGAGHAQVIGP
jgi:hypothetical protein